MSIQDALDRDYAEAWRPTAGDSLFGEVVEIGERAGEHGSYPIVTVKQTDGEERAFHAFHTVAANQLAEARPKVGDEIGIRYKGKVSGEGPHGDYHSYRVVVDRPSRDIDWAQYGEVPQDIAEDEARAAAQAEVEAERDERDADLTF